ncbi:MAG: alkaline phosphatase D family protein [Micromonosporaceae bacterium]
MGQRFSRRTLLRGGVLTGAVAAGATLAGSAAYGLVRSGRPTLTHGVQSGDVGGGSGVVWTRADRPGRMMVEVSRSETFRRSWTVPGPVVTPETDFTGKVRLTDLPRGSRLFYRVTVEDLDSGAASEPLTGSFSTTPADRRGVRFLWSGDICGQGWGINPDLGGITIFDRMGQLRPDFFLCGGDTVYSDNPLTGTVTLPDGRVWRNRVTEEKSKVAESLAEFRGQFAYNMLDDNVRGFLADVPMINQWDDHEVMNNWSPGAEVTDPRYTERRMDVLAARAKRAFHEWLPLQPAPTDPNGRIYRKIPYGPLLDVFVLDMRTVKDPNSSNRYTDPAQGVGGAEQRDWLIRELAASTATWKVIANDLPLGLVVPAGSGRYEGVAQEDHGVPLGRELQLAEVLQASHRNGVTGMVFLTGDVHYSAAIHYDPARAAIDDFTPFWEFVSGPLHAGGFGPNRLDRTFGPETRYQHAPPKPNWTPWDGFQHFGEVAVDGDTEVMTVRLRDQDGQVLYSVDLTP